MNLFDRMRSSRAATGSVAERSGLVNLFETWTSDKPSEKSEEDFISYVKDGMQGNGVIWALVLMRMTFFAQMEFAFQDLDDRTLSGNPKLKILETPWPNGSTQELLARMEQDVSMAGNAYIYRAEDDRLQRLRPDWVEIITDAHELVGYRYTPGGPKGSPGNPEAKGKLILPDELAHWSPYPDPLAVFRGMSWMTPMVREILADKQMSRHKQKFFDNAAPQPLTAKVLTPTGWSTMGDLQIGAQVIGADGKPHAVSGVYPQGTLENYRVRFADGGETRCSLNHVWQVSTAYDRQRGVTQLLALDDMVRAGIRYDSGSAKWAVPMHDPVEYAAQGELPLDPYLLGLLLGDGSFRGNGKGSGGVGLAVAKDDVDDTVEHITPLLPDGVSISRRDRGGWSEFYFRGLGGPRPNPLTAAIKKLGLWNLLGRDKFIPAAYLRAPAKDRLALLQGLIDSDGHVAGSAVSFTTTSRKLADGLAELTFGLGGLSSIRFVNERQQWTVLVKRLPDWMMPARLSRKTARYRLPNSVRHRQIVAVERCGAEEMRCIRVDSADHLYVTDDYIVTHNTPNLLIKNTKMLDEKSRDRLRAVMETRYEGAENAYRTLVLEGGADATVIGSSMQQMSFDAIQAAGENRIAAAAGVPGIVAGFKEGLQAATYSNYAQAKRHYVDGTLTFNWGSVSKALEVLVSVPEKSRLWYDTTRIPALKEDRAAQAEIMKAQAAAVAAWVAAGYDPVDVEKYVTTGERPAAGIKHVGVPANTPPAPPMVEGPPPSSNGQGPPEQEGSPGAPPVADTAKVAASPTLTEEQKKEKSKQKKQQVFADVG